VIALIRHEVLKALRAHGRVCAVELLASHPSAATWALVAAECESLGSARGHYRRSILSRACDLVALGLPDDAAHVLAVECGMSDIEWADETRREVAS
jgi:hypothetical protein